MERNKLSILVRENISTIAIIAVILGAAGLGAGAYSVISVQTGAVKGDEGDDGDDGPAGITTIVYRTENEYPCSSQTEIENALVSIGTGHGKIILTENIILSSTIDIDGGGSYIIQGAGSITIDVGGDYASFDITIARSLIIRDLIMDISDLGASTVNLNINEISDNPIFIDSVQFIGDASKWGYGIYIQSDNVWVSNCYFYQLFTGILALSKTHISGNTISDIFDKGIRIDGDYNVIESNFINIISLGKRGIDINSGHYNTITGNVINGSTEDDTTWRAGIILNSASNNTVVGNSCFNFKNIDGTGVGYGIRIAGGASIENTVLGNTALNNEKDFLDDGNNTFGNYTNNNFFT